MTRYATHSSPIKSGLLTAVALFLALIAAGCTSAGGGLPYEETFDQQGAWSTGEDAFSVGQVADAVYDFTLLESDLTRWAAAGQSFADGVYSVDARPVAGPLDNGYGLLFRANPEKGDFYLFEISADGYAWIGRYVDGAEDATIVGSHWFATPAVNQGLNVTNNLRVEAVAGNLIFSVNGQEIGRVTDNTFAEGDIGLLVQSFGESGVQIQFDNLTVVAN